jgi:hypothetical protein
MHEAQGSCTNNRQIITATFEDRVLSGLRERMLDLELVAIFVREYHGEHATVYRGPPIKRQA